MTAQTKAQKARTKLRSRDIRMTVLRVMIPETGEMIGALVPDHPIDRRSMKERKLHVGKMVRATLREDRNPMFWRKAHVLGGWLADNVESFAGLDMHQALKKLQERSGIGCTTREVNARPIVAAVMAAASSLLGEGACRMLAAVLPEIQTVSITEADSLNFSDMDEGVFSSLWDGWIEWLRRNAWPHLAPASREEVEMLIENPREGTHA